MLLEGAASLDIVQIGARLDEQRPSWKVALVQTHPLHLWRYERMAALARGLEHEQMDREAVLEQLERPEHSPGVLWRTSFLEGRGGGQPLPIARERCRLAVFENLRNAYSGSDGIEALRAAVRADRRQPYAAAAARARQSAEGERVAPGVPQGQSWAPAGVRGRRCSSKPIRRGIANYDRALCAYGDVEAQQIDEHGDGFVGHSLVPCCGALRQCLAPGLAHTRARSSAGQGRTNAAGELRIHHVRAEVSVAVLRPVSARLP